MANKIDSNLTGLAIAEESSLKVLPGSPVWYELEPNSYADFGSEISTVAREPINPSRQRKKGVVVDLDASGGFNMDFTSEISKRLAQGFFFADAREKFSTQKLNAAAIPITSTTTSTYTAASGLTGFKAGDLVFASGFANAANNGIKRVTTVLAGVLTVVETLVTEAAPPATAKIEACGFQGASADINLTTDSTSVTLTSTALDFTTLGLTVGEFVFVGGDAVATKFANNAPGYARVKSVAAHALVFDDTTWTPVNETGTGKTIQIFFGTVIRNEKTASLIKRRSYNIERQLGNDGVGTQSEYLEGAIANEFKLNIPQADKLNADLSFVAMDNVQRSGTEGIKAGTRVPAPIEDAFNTASNLYRVKLSIVDPLTLNKTALFAYVSEADISINNNVSPNKALAVLGAFDASVGNFEVFGSVTAYFADVAAVAAVRQNSNVALNIIGATDNKGFVFDMPLISLGGGRLNVEKDAPIMIPLEANAAECPAGYTLLLTFFCYLPTAAMPA